MSVFAIYICIYAKQSSRFNKRYQSFFFFFFFLSFHEIGNTVKKHGFIVIRERIINIDKYTIARFHRSILGDKYFSCNFAIKFRPPNYPIVDGLLKITVKARGGEGDRESGIRVSAQQPEVALYARARIPGLIVRKEIIPCADLHTFPRPLSEASN